MFEPQKGNIAIGSNRSLPTAPCCAAVVSLAMIDPRNTPCSQSNACVTNGTVVRRLPPNKIALIGTPRGSSHSGAMEGHCAAGAVNRALGWAAVVDASGVHGWPRQSVALAGLSLVMPSHHTSPWSVSAVLVKMQLPHNVSMALGLVSYPVPGATPKKPASGLMAYRRPSAPNFIQQMSSPTVSAFHPGIVGLSMARLVLPHAEGNAAAMYFDSPAGLVSLRISMCSANQPSSRAMTDAIRSAKHFLPSKALPPYPDPYDQISRVSGKCTMYLLSGLHGHGTSASPAARGAPTECTHGTHSSWPRTSSAFWPMRVMIRMLA